ncbi:MAG TPA: hypothetical protein VGJ70_00025 [Solirubrobacteraceae bacterium]
MGVVLALCAAAPAHAQRLVTLDTTSRFVDPAKQQFNKPPCGEPGRPNALRVNGLLPDGYDKGGRFPVVAPARAQTASAKRRDGSGVDSGFLTQGPIAPQGRTHCPVFAPLSCLDVA